jgi:cyclophilin family peptidyl-prolyl cis-trans isomerase
MIRSALIEKFGFEESNIRIQFGRDEEDPEPDQWKTDGRATKDELLKEAEQLVANTTDDDTAWVFLLGHTYYDGSTVFFNVPDIDIQHQEFTSSFEKLKGSSVFFICTPASGHFIKGLSQKNRIVITATEAEWETNGSIFHIHLSKTLASILPTPEFDCDDDGTVTLVDLYIKTTRDMVDAYLGGETPLYPTEHPNFDDNGDGKGSELQANFLTPEQGGQMGTKRRKQSHKDGALASQNPLFFKLEKAR